MEKTRVESLDAPLAIGPYSQAVRSVARELVFVSGQIGLDPVSGEMAGDTIEGQTEQCLKNVLAIVKAAGGEKKSIVRTAVYLKRLDDFGAMNKVYASFMEPPHPARACIGGCDLPKGALVEIEAIAAI